MKWRRLRWVTFVGALLALASISIDCGRTLQVVDAEGAPVESLYAVFHREGHRLSLVHPVSYQAGPRVLVRGSAGRVEIPASAHVHWPFPIESHPRILVDLVYAPSLHNGHASIFDFAISVPGAFEVGADLAHVKLSDLSGSPAAWEGTLRNLSAVLDRLGGERSSEKAGAQANALTRELIGRFSQEYAQFLERYRAVLRPRPEPAPGLQFASEEERRAWSKMVDEDLAREPFWGDVAERLFARDVKRWSSVASELR